MVSAGSSHSTVVSPPSIIGRGRRGIVAGRVRGESPADGSDSSALASEVECGECERVRVEVALIFGTSNGI